MPRENGQIRPSSRRSGYLRSGSSQHLASVLQEGGGNANIDAGLGFIWRISDQTHSSLANRRSAPQAFDNSTSPRADSG